MFLSGGNLKHSDHTKTIQKDPHVNNDDEQFGVDFTKLFSSLVCKVRDNQYCFFTLWPDHGWFSSVFFSLTSRNCA